jgi:hypothetical protein
MAAKLCLPAMTPASVSGLSKREYALKILYRTGLCEAKVSVTSAGAAMEGSWSARAVTASSRCLPDDCQRLSEITEANNSYFVDDAVL